MPDNPFPHFGITGDGRRHEQAGPNLRDLRQLEREVAFPRPGAAGDQGDPGMKKGFTLVRG